MNFRYAYFFQYSYGVELREWWRPVEGYSEPSMLNSPYQRGDVVEHDGEMVTILNVYVDFNPSN